MGSGELGLVKVPCVKKKYRKKWTVQTLNKSTKSSAKKNLQIKVKSRNGLDLKEVACAPLRLLQQPLLLPVN